MVALHECPPLTKTELQFRDLYELTAKQIEFDPMTADFEQFAALREAMLPELDVIMQPVRDKWHRMPAYAPDTLTAKDVQDFRYIPNACYARYIPMAEHASESYEIVLCPHGSNRHFIAQQPVDLTVGDVLILGPGAVNAVGAFGEDCIRRSLLLRRTRTTEHFSILLEGDGALARFLRHTVDGYGGNSWALFHMGDALQQDPAMQWLYEHPADTAIDPTRAALEDGLLMSFFARMEMHCGESAQLHLWESPQVEDAIMECIHLEFATLERSELAKRFGYSERQLLRIVQRRTGMSFREYVTELKLNYIADMLIHTNYPIVRVLESAGYDHNNTIYKQFKNKFGMAPKEYRAASR